MTGIETGATVVVAGRSGVYEGSGPNGLRVRWPDGSAEWVPPHLATLTGNAVTSPPPPVSDDPFASLASTLTTTLAAIEEALDKDLARIARRRDQIKKLRAVLRALGAEDGSSARPKTQRTWTPEQREAAAERMRQRNKGKSTNGQAAAMAVATS